jgi:hypothetical protein
VWLDNKDEKNSRVEIFEWDGLAVFHMAAYNGYSHLFIDLSCNMRFLCLKRVHGFMPLVFEK